MTSNISFFEIKLKNNKRRTVKERIQIEADVPVVTKNESDFLFENTPFWNARGEVRFENSESVAHRGLVNIFEWNVISKLF